MTSTRYFEPQGHSERLSSGIVDVSCPSPPPAASYPSQELDSYCTSGVAPFEYPSASDPTLLTPISSAPSPPLQPKVPPQTANIFGSPQTAVLGAQGPTPPSTSRMYYNSYELSSSQSSSPMTVHPQTTEGANFEMSAYVTSHSPGSAHHASPRDDQLPPPPIDPYLPYVVSSGNDLDVSAALYPSLYATVEPQQSPNTSYMVRSHGPQAVPVTTPQLHRLAPATANMAHAQSHTYHGSQSRLEDLNGNHGMLPGIHGGQFGSFSHTMTSTRRPAGRRRPSQQRKPARNQKPQPIATSLEGTSASKSADDGLAVKKDFITLAEGCTPDDRRLFELRLKWDHLKGKGMWDKIWDEFEENAQNKGREALQMRIHRMVTKFGLWPASEEALLREAFDWCNENFAKLVLQRLKETGGCSCWDWKPDHVDAKLVSMGLMEPKREDKPNERRQRKSSRRRAETTTPYQQPLHGSMGEWPGGVEVHAAYPGSVSQSFEMMHQPGQPQDRASDLPGQQTEELMDDIFRHKMQFKPDPDGSMSPDAMDLAYHNDGHGTVMMSSTSAPEVQPMRMSQSPPLGRDELSTRVARQAVHQYLDNDHYRTHRP